MTLIAAVNAHNMASFLFSDLAISGGVPLESSAFPIQFNGGDGFFEAGKIENRVLSGAARKMVTFGPHAFLWAGSYVTAIALIRHFFDNRSSLSPETFARLSNGFGISRLEKIQLIYSFSDAAGTITTHLNCVELKIGEIHVVAGGSGAWRILEEFDQLHGVQSKTPFQFVTARLMHLYNMEMSDETAYDFGIGIGYEVTSPTKDSWQKIPYCLSVYSHNEKSFGLRKMLSTAYFGEALIVLSVSIKNGANYTVPDEDWTFLQSIVQTSGQNMHTIHDLLLRDSNLDASEFGLDYKQSKVEPDFSLCIMEGYSNGRNGPKKVGTGFASDFPATAALVKKGTRVGFWRRAIEMRRAEEFFLGRDFVPPSDKLDFYDKQKEDQNLGKRADLAKLFQ